MIDTTNISENYSKAKDTIIRLIADRYRPEYYDLIVDRINRAYIDFSSTPDEEYQYMLEHDKYFSTEDKAIITENYEQYKRIEDEARKNSFDLLFEYVSDKLAVDCADPTDRDLFISLFSDPNFNGSFIDAFRSKNIALINAENVLSCIKESIAND